MQIKLPKTASTEDCFAYQKELGKELRKLKKTHNVESVRQGYKGTGSQRLRKQVWINHPSLSRGTMDLWIFGTRMEVGRGVVGLPRYLCFEISFEAHTPKEVAAIVGATLQNLDS